MDHGHFPCVPDAFSMVPVLLAMSALPHSVGSGVRVFVARNISFTVDAKCRLTARVIIVTVHRFVLPGSIRPSVFEGTRPLG